MEILRRARVDIDPGTGPEALPLKWRVLYTIIDAFDDLRGSVADCVLEGQLIARLANDSELATELGIEPPKSGNTVDDYAASIDSSARARVRDILTELKVDILVTVQDDPMRGWLIIPLATGYGLVTQWRRRWIAQRPFSFIRDEALWRRCSDVLLRGRPGQYDTIIRDACVVLEDRVRRVSGADKSKFGTRLIRYAFDPQQNGGWPRVELFADRDEQEGVLQLSLGIMQLFRNPTSHALVASYTREDAVRIVGLVDWLLGLLPS